MNITYLIPFLFALSLSGCMGVSNTHESPDYGEPLKLGQDCSELAGTYLNEGAFTDDSQERGRLELLLEESKDARERTYMWSKSKTVTFSFPEKGALRIDRKFSSGELLDYKTLLESKGDYQCSNGELFIRNSDVEGSGVAGGLLMDVTIRSSTTSFTITTKKYLQVKVSRSESGVAVALFVLPIPVAVSGSHYRYFAPYDTDLPRPEPSQSQVEARESEIAHIGQFLHKKGWGGDSILLVWLDGRDYHYDSGYYAPREIMAGKHFGVVFLKDFGCWSGIVLTAKAGRIYTYDYEQTDNQIYVLVKDRTGSVAAKALCEKGDYYIEDFNPVTRRMEREFKEWLNQGRPE